MEDFQILGENMAEGKGEGQVAIVEYRQEGGEEVPTLMLIKEGLQYFFIKINVI